MTFPILLLIVAVAAVVAGFFFWMMARQRAEEIALLRTQIAERELRIDQMTQRVEQIQQREANANNELAALRSTLAQSERAAEEKLKLLAEAKQQLSHEFQTLAQRIFEEKSERFTKQNRENIEGTLNPLREQLLEFRKRVDDVYDKESKDRTSLRAELSHLKELNQRMSIEALNLTRALKGDNKAQGNWGEVVLERVLEESGLRKGHEYETQVALANTEGRRFQPDVVVHLPDAKDIVIDAKVSLIHYERYCNADTEIERETGLKQHIASVRAHIDGLSLKQYENLPGVRSLDFVLIFIPIEAAFLAAFEHDPALFRAAYEKNIIVVSPTTLLATLRTVQTIWRYERQNANAEVIARQAGNLHDQFARVLEALQDVGRHLEKSRGAYELTLDRFSRGKGNMVKRVADIAKLGAKTKRGLPPELLANSDDTLDFLPDAPDRVDDETDSNEASASTPFENGD